MVAEKKLDIEKYLKTTQKSSYEARHKHYSAFQSGWIQGYIRAKVGSAQIFHQRPLDEDALCKLVRTWEQQSLKAWTSLEIEQRPQAKTHYIWIGEMDDCSVYRNASDDRLSMEKEFDRLVLMNKDELKRWEELQKGRI